MAAAAQNDLVTDPDLIAQLEASVTPKPAPPTLVTDPALLARLEAADPTARDREQAGVAGFWNGATHLAGAVPDAFFNASNLIKAGAGTAYGALTPDDQSPMRTPGINGPSLYHYRDPSGQEVYSRNPPPAGATPVKLGHALPSWLEAGDANPVGNKLAEALDKFHSLTPTTLDRPDDPASRYIATAAGVVPGAVAGGSSVLSSLRNTAAAVPAAEVGQFAAEHPVFNDKTESGRAANTAAALAAQSIASEFGPAAAVPLKKMLRSGASRDDIRQNIEDFRAVTGQTPTWGQATGSHTVLGAEQVAGHGFGGQDPFERLRDKQQEGAAGNLQGLVDALGGVRGREAMGDVIQGGVRGFQARNVNGRDPITGQPNSRYNALQANAESLVPSDLMVQPTNSIPAFKSAASPISDPNALANALLHSRSFASRQAEALAADAAPIAPSATPIAGGVMGATPAPGKPAGIAYPTFRQIRSQVGAAAFPDSPMNPLLTTPEQRSLQGGYGAMNKDLVEALQGLPPGQAAPAAAAQSRADRFYSANQTRLQQLARFTDTPTPEAAATQFTSAVRNQSTSVLRTLKKSLLPEERANVVGATIDDLGRATNSNQNADNNAFSFQTFMTQYAGLRPEVRDTIFSGFPQADELRTALDRLNRVSQNIAKGGRVMQSTSGTGPFNQASHDTSNAMLAGGAVLTGHWGAAMALTAMPGLRAISSRTMMTNPNFVNWLASANTATPKAALAHLTALNNLISREADPRAKAEMGQFRDSVAPALGAASTP